MRYFSANSFCLKLLAVAVFAAGFCSVGAKAQLPQQPQLPPISRPPGSPGQSPTAGDNNDEDTMAHRAMMQQAERRNEQRQQDIVNDTAKLLTLAQQLKTEVEKSNKDPMSASEMKKAEEIEKLAKAVKEKMRGS